MLENNFKPTSSPTPHFVGVTLFVTFPNIVNPGKAEFVHGRNVADYKIVEAYRPTINGRSFRMATGKQQYALVSAKWKPSYTLQKTAELITTANSSISTVNGGYPQMPEIF